MSHEFRIRTRAARISKSRNGVSLRIGKWPAGVVVLQHDLDVATGKLEGLAISELLYDEDQLDDNLAQNQRRYPRGIPVISTPGARRASAYLLTTTIPTITVEVELRRRYRKTECRRESPAGASRPLARPVYQARARVVMTCKFKVDREIKKFTKDNRWLLDQIEKDPRGLRASRHEGQCTQFRLLPEILRKAKCIKPRAGERYTWQRVGRNLKRELFPFE